MSCCPVRTRRTPRPPRQHVMRRWRVHSRTLSAEALMRLPASSWKQRFRLLGPCVGSSDCAGRWHGAPVSGAARLCLAVASPPWPFPCMVDPKRNGRRFAASRTACAHSTVARRQGGLGAWRGGARGEGRVKWAQVGSAWLLRTRRYGRTASRISLSVQARPADQKPSNAPSCGHWPQGSRPLGCSIRPVIGDKTPSASS